MARPLIEIQQLSKSFAGNRALDQVSLSVHRGEIVALLGHNGSGKSTLVKCLSGAHEADEGSILAGPEGGTSLHFIHQDLGLVPGLTVAENLSLVRRMPYFGLAPVPRKAERAHLTELLAGFCHGIDPDARVGTLTPAQQTIVAIVRALDGWRAEDNVLVLDEPTATLHGEEAELLLDTVGRIAARGAGVLYISHRLAEVERIANRAVVLKNGRVVAEKASGEFNAADLARLIAGEDFGSTRQAPAPVTGETVLDVQGLSSTKLRTFDLVLHRGEILGVAGLVGSGMEELCGLLIGAVLPRTGRTRVRGVLIRPGDPGAAIRAGLAYVPADRRRRGGFGAFPARENISLPRLAPLVSWAGHIDRRREDDEVRDWMERLKVQPAGAIEHPFALFSGGNQQKIVLAKWLRMHPDVLLVEEPTQGVDAGAQAEIHRLITEAAARGMAVLVSSSDTQELAGLCHRVVVLRDDRAPSTVSGEDLTEAALVAAMLSHTVATTAPESQT